MPKKIAILTMVTLIILSMFTGCLGSPSPTSNYAAPEKVAIVLPESFIPDGVEFEYDDENDSSAYYQVAMTPEAALDFYKTAFDEIGAVNLVELTEEELLDGKIIPEPASDSLGNIVWVYYGNYEIPVIESPDGEKAEAKQGHVIAVCAHEGDNIGVEVAIAYRAENIARSFGIIKPEKQA